MNSDAVPGFQHRTVLLDEAVDALAVDGARRNGVFVDGTFGRGGHSRKILERLGPQGRLIAFDKDPQAIASAEELSKAVRFFYIILVCFAVLLLALALRVI